MLIPLTITPSNKDATVTPSKVAVSITPGQQTTTITPANSNVLLVPGPAAPTVITIIPPPTVQFKPATPIVMATVLYDVLRGVAGPAGPIGPTGPMTSAGTFVASQSLLAGQPVRISRANGQAGLANAAVYTDSFITGLASTSVAAGFPVVVALGRWDMADWAAVAGTTLLTVGMPYFLKPGGGITTTAPSKPNSMASAFVGTAVATTALFVSPGNPLLL